MATAVRAQTTWAWFAFATGWFLLGCGLRTGLEGGLVGAAGGTAGRDGSVSEVSTGDAQTPRAPQHHRATSTTCPQQRGPGLPGLAPPCTPDAGPQTACWQDGDCTAGQNGRCLPLSGPIAIACWSQCSYDACFTDADCPAGEPCACRSSAADSAANTCVSGSNCQIDADCGPGGYCSPSQVGVLCFCPSSALCDDSGSCYVMTTQGWQEVPCACGDSCGHGYFCHTPGDTCLDDDDCASQGGTCNYDRLDNIWSCSICWPVP